MKTTECPRCKQTVAAPPVGDLVLCIDCTARLDRLRAAASKGGKTTAARHDMAELGRRGFEAFAAKHCSDRGAAVAFLQKYRGLRNAPGYQRPSAPKNEYGTPTGRTIIAGEN